MLLHDHERSDGVDVHVDVRGSGSADEYEYSDDDDDDDDVDDVYMLMVVVPQHVNNCHVQLLGLELDPCGKMSGFLLWFLLAHCQPDAFLRMSPPLMSKMSMCEPLRWTGKGREKVLLIPTTQV